MKRAVIAPVPRPLRGLGMTLLRLHSGVLQLAPQRAVGWSNHAEGLDDHAVRFWRCTESVRSTHLALDFFVLAEL